MKKILIIEDEEALSELYEMKFKQDGYQVITACDGQKGLELAKSQQPDLVLLDLVLPKMDGYQVLKELKKDSKTKNIKIYILSNLGQSGEIDRGFKKGADGYFIKADLTPSQLVENVKDIFSGRTVKIKKSRGVFISPGAEIAGNKEIKSKPTRILLIEDEEDIIDMYKLSLERAGFEVEAAKNGAWGFKLAAQKAFDVIIMDMVMPAMNGCDAIQKLKIDSRTKYVPVIVLSNSAQDKDIEQAKKRGAACYLLKSQITPAKLVQEVEKALKNKI